MGYRLPDNCRHSPYKCLHDTATQSIINIDNGSISRISIPCFYSYEHHHDKNKHDHFGWPSPGHRDKSCQLPPGYDHVLVLKEIDLPAEGYTSIEVSLLDPPDGLEFTGMIEYDSIRLTITSMCPSAENEDIEVKFSVFAVGNSDFYGDYEEPVELRDIVTKGILHIVAGPIG